MKPKVKVNVGDYVSERIEGHSGKMSGIVIYVHPKGLYYTAEFVGPTGLTFRESFTGVRYLTTAYR